MPIEVPAHVQYAQEITNSTRVVGGTNWDLSRAAVETPVKALPPPPPPPAPPTPPLSETPYVSGPLVGLTPAAVLSFTFNGKDVDKDTGKSLCKTLPKGSYRLAGHARSDESKRVGYDRVHAVAKVLQGCKRKVLSYESFGAALPLTERASHADLNSRVEVFYVRK